MDNIDNTSNGSAPGAFTYLWFSMISQAFTLQESMSDRDCDIHLRVFEGEKPRKVLEGIYSSCFQMPPVSSLLLDLLLRLQRALLEVTPVVNGVLIPDMPLDIATAVEIGRESGKHWVFVYTADDVRYTVRCKDGLLEMKANDTWEICATPRFHSVLSFINGVIRRVTPDQGYSSDWRNRVRFMPWDEPPERVDAQCAAIAGYLTRHPQAPLSEEEEEDTESGEEGENNASAEIWE